MSVFQEETRIGKYKLAEGIKHLTIVTLGAYKVAFGKAPWHLGYIKQPLRILAIDFEFQIFPFCPFQSCMHVSPLVSSTTPKKIAQVTRGY